MTSTVSLADSNWRMSYFEVLVALSQIFGFSMIILSGYFFNSMGEGIVWPTAGSNNLPYQNFHGFFMITGLVFFQGEALLSYRLYRHDVKILSKFIHVVFHILAIGFFTTAFACVIIQKNLADNKSFASVHSWIGLAVMFVYTVQFLFGFINFLMPGVSLRTKQAFMPLHRIIGTISFTACTIQSVIGHTQYIILAQSHQQFCYFVLDCAGHLDYIYNFSMISLVLYSITVLIIVLPPAWRREKTPDEMK